MKELTPSRFENYIAELYSKPGYSTKVIGGRYDGGVDVIIEKDGIKSFIQCKRYNKSTVSLHNVRDFYGALANNLANGKGIFITTNIFSTEAEQFAKGKPIELIDGFKLIKLIKTVGDKSDVPVVKNNDTKCPKCGGQLIIKTGKFGKFYGCSNFPQCKFSKKYKYPS